MNTVYKVVFSKARGALMVVNEITKSHQVGKKAAVAVGVAGALAMGFGSAFAEDSYPITGEHTLQADTTWESSIANVVQNATLDLNNYDLTITSSSNAGGRDTLGVLGGTVNLNFAQCLQPVFFKDQYPLSYPTAGVVPKNGRKGPLPRALHPV